MAHTIKGLRKEFKAIGKWFFFKAHDHHGQQTEGKYHQITHYDRIHHNEEEVIVLHANTGQSAYYNAKHNIFDWRDDPTTIPPDLLAPTTTQPTPTHNPPTPTQEALF